MNNNDVEFAVQLETQENIVLGSPMIEQMVKPVKRKTKSEIIEENGQEEPDDTKSEPFKIKSESKIEEVDLDNKVNHGTTEQLNVFKKEPTEDIKKENKFDIKTSKNNLKVLK